MGQRVVMKSASLPKPTITGTLWLGFGLLVLVLALTLLIYNWQIQRIDSQVTQMVEVQEPLEQAALEMRLNAGNIARSMSDYIRDRDPTHVEKARDSETGFEKVAVRFDELAQSDETRRLSQEIDKLYGEFKESAHGVVILVDQQYASLLSFQEEVKEINVLINSMLQATVDGTPPDAMKKLETVLNMQSSLDKVSIAIEAYTAEPDPGLRQEISDGQEDFKRFGAMYRETSLSAYENSWLNHIDGKFEEVISDGTEIFTITDNLHGLIAQFEQSFQEMDTYFAEHVQPLVHAEMLAGSENMKASATSAGIWLLALGVIGVLIGIASILVISRRIARPIRDLLDGATIVGSGRIEHRFNIDAKGEFGQLALALNKMLQNLERSREALGESEELAWAILDATSDAVILTDPRGVILASNEVAAGRLGMSLEQMIDESIYDLLTAESAAPMKAHIAEVIRSRKPVHYEDEREGKITDQNIYPVFGAKGEITKIAIFSCDVTVRKWVEDVTEQLGRRNELILEAAGEGIYGLDTQGRTTFVNPAAARMLGYKPEDLIGRRHHELVHHSKPDGKPYPNQQCPIYAAFKDGTVHTNVDDEVFWRRDGNSFPVEYTSTPIIEDGKILGAVVTFRDITDRRRVEKALRQSAEQYRSIVEAAASLIVSVDQEGCIVDCNARAQQLLGYAPSEIIGRQLVEIVHPDEQTNAEEMLKEVLTKGSEYDKQYRLVRKDGTFIDVSLNAAVARDATGEYIRTICMIDKMTE